MSKGKLVVLLAIVVAIAAFFIFDVKQYLTLEFVKSQSTALETAVQENPLRAAAIFFAIYVAVTGLSLPGAAILTLVAGAVFGLLYTRSSFRSHPRSERRSPFSLPDISFATGSRASSATS